MNPKERAVKLIVQYYEETGQSLISLPYEQIAYYVYDSITESKEDELYDIINAIVQIQGLNASRTDHSLPSHLQ